MTDEKLEIIKFKTEEEATECLDDLKKEYLKIFKGETNERI